MLGSRSFNPICASCRLQSLLLRQAQLRAPTRRFSSLPTRSRTDSAPPRFVGRQYAGFRSRGLRTSAKARDSELRQDEIRGEEGAAPPPSVDLADEQNSIEGQDGINGNAGARVREVEDLVRTARQRFGDYLPDGYLSKEELRVYERLYGPAITFADEFEESVEVEEGNLAVESGQGERNALLRRTEAGDFEEVEYVEEEAEDGHEDEEFLEQEDFENESAESQGAEGDVLQAPQKITYLRARRDIERAHPLTEAGRFSTFPQTIQIPQSIVEPSTTILSVAKNKHLEEHAHEIFGGKPLPTSVSTPLRVAQQQLHTPIPLEASQNAMTNIEGDVFVATMLPGLYATAVSTLVETRRRLGSQWIERLIQKEGGPTVLDAGAGGAAVMAWRDILKAEWDIMRESNGNTDGPSAAPGKQTVITGSDILRHKISPMLENTQFLPRLPDTILDWQTEGSQARKTYDIIVASHLLWGLKEDFLKKQMVQRLWSLLNPDGGVLIMLEKGVPRGFESIAGARKMLLDNHITRPGSTDVDPHADDIHGRSIKKETGHIIAPCTNHDGCPLYVEEGESRSRKDYCQFSQAFVRPPYLQRISGKLSSNHETIRFSYLSVQRGRDQRLSEHDTHGQGITQGDTATSLAFAGHESIAPSPVDAKDQSDVVYLDEPDQSNPSDEADASSENDPLLNTLPAPSPLNTLTLPRILYPPLKRRGHVILDVCTPSGTLERWTVPRSHSRQAYRDARKAQWGDLWGLGAKTRVPRNVRLGKGAAAQPTDAKSKTNGRKFAHKSGAGSGPGSADSSSQPQIDMSSTGMRLRRGKIQSEAYARKATRRQKRALKEAEREMRDAEDVREMEEKVFQEREPGWAGVQREIERLERGGRRS